MNWTAAVYGFIAKVVGFVVELFAQPLLAPLVKAYPLKLWVVLLIAFGCFFAGCRCAAVDPQRKDDPKSCPVAGNQCPCGCRTGGQCTCTAEKQKADYFSLLKTLKPGDRFTVYIGQNAPDGSKAVRWDGYPNANGRQVIQGIMTAHGPFEYVPTVPYQRQLYAVTFGGACVGGR